MWIMEKLMFKDSKATIMTYQRCESIEWTLEDYGYNQHQGSSNLSKTKEDLDFLLLLNVNDIAKI